MFGSKHNYPEFNNVIDYWLNTRELHSNFVHDGVEFIRFPGKARREYHIVVSTREIMIEAPGGALRTRYRFHPQSSIHEFARKHNATPEIPQALEGL